ncbi:MAG: hypothetical protein AB7G44_11930 [Bacteroidia bacterium]
MKNLSSISISRKFQLLFFGVAFFPLFAFSQSNPEKSKQSDYPQISNTQAAPASHPADNQDKSQKWSEEPRYNVKKRNKKIERTKTEQSKGTETVTEGESTRGETKKERKSKK